MTGIQVHCDDFRGIQGRFFLPLQTIIVGPDVPERTGVLHAVSLALTGRPFHGGTWSREDLAAQGRRWRIEVHMNLQGGREVEAEATFDGETFTRRTDFDLQLYQGDDQALIEPDEVAVFRMALGDIYDSLANMGPVIRATLQRARITREEAAEVLEEAPEDLEGFIAYLRGLRANLASGTEGQSGNLGRQGVIAALLKAAREIRNSMGGLVARMMREELTVFPASDKVVVDLRDDRLTMVRRGRTFPPSGLSRQQRLLLATRIATRFHWKKSPGLLALEGLEEMDEVHGEALRFLVHRAQEYRMLATSSVSRPWMEGFEMPLAKLIGG